MGFYLPSQSINSISEVITVLLSFSSEENEKSRWYTCHNDLCWNRWAARFCHQVSNHIWANDLTFLKQFAPPKMAIREITLLKIWLKGKTNMNNLKVFFEYKMSDNVQLSRRDNSYRCIFSLLITICYSDYQEKWVDWLIVDWLTTLLL